MLGSMVHDWLQRDPDLNVRGTARCASPTYSLLDAEQETPDLAGVNWVVNCVGVIKPYIKDDNRSEVLRALKVNSIFPMRLADVAERSGARVLQIATDCVYSGRDGMYTEQAAHDATDAYGKSKSLGEIRSSHVAHLRCSIIGPEQHGFVSLLEWFLKQPRGAKLNGYRNHSWNGVTTLHYAKLCQAIIKGAEFRPGVSHVVPSGDITKAALLRSFARHYSRLDLTISDVDAPVVIDRRLGTADPAFSASLWRSAGYTAPPTVEEMVAELATYGRPAQVP
jgi:dTDP-4-dehydrorhamnose reductase